MFHLNHLGAKREHQSLRHGQPWTALNLLHSILGLMRKLRAGKGVGPTSSFADSYGHFHYLEGQCGEWSHAGHGSPLAKPHILFCKMKLIMKSTLRAFMRRNEMRRKQLLARSWQETHPGDLAAVIIPVSWVLVTSLRFHPQLMSSPYQFLSETL